VRETRRGRKRRKMPRAGTRALLAAAIAAVLLAQGEGFYLPGVAPRKYVPGEQLMVKVNTLTSDLTPLQVCDSLVSGIGHARAPRELRSACLTPMSARVHPAV
jgi:hypothetical protein